MSCANAQAALETIVTVIADDIDWEAWTTDDDGPRESDTPSHWTVLQVLYCKLNWLREELGEDHEHADLLHHVQSIVETLQPFATSV
jgi:hypothetical protein